MKMYMVTKGLHEDDFRIKNVGGTWGKCYVVQQKKRFLRIPWWSAVTGVIRYDQARDVLDYLRHLCGVDMSPKDYFVGKENESH